MIKKPGKIIKPARRPGLSSATSNEWAWQRLDQAISDIYNRNASHWSFEELHRHAYGMVLQKEGQLLYDNTRQAITRHLNNILNSTIRPKYPLQSCLGPGASMESVLQQCMDSSLADTTNKLEGTEYLSSIDVAWQRHNLAMKSISDILLYLDKTYLKPQNPPVPLVYDMGLDLFRDVILESPEVFGRLVETLLRLIFVDRQGDVADKMLLRSITDMMSKLEPRQSKLDPTPTSSWFHAQIEPLHLQATDVYYTQLARHLLSSQDAVEYCKSAEKRLREEEERHSLYMGDASTVEKVRKMVETRLLRDHLNTLLDLPNNGVIQQMQYDKYDDLHRLYLLLQPVDDGHVMMSRHAKTFARRLIEEVNENLSRVDDSRSSTDAIKWVQAMMNVHGKFSDMVTKSFASSKLFLNEINSSFEHAMNANEKAPEYLSLFVDDHFKRGVKDMEEHESNSVLDKVVTLFRFLHDKDVFERYYKQHLARRMLTAKVVAEDAEKSLVNKLQVECGSQFTSKLEGMFKDMRLSKDLSIDFRLHLNHLNIVLPEVAVNVLTSTFWPLQQQDQDTILYPEEIQQAMRRFSEYYAVKHTGRKLRWHPTFGGADVKAIFENGTRKEMSVSQFAMIVLCQAFNDENNPWKRLDEISIQTGIPDADLRRTLQSLALGKFKVLSKSTPKQRQVLDTDEFRVNPNFTTPVARFKIPMIAVTEDDVQRNDTMAKVEETRIPVVEATIVRLMKSRKQMSHNDLVNETVRQLQSRFSPDVAFIKKRIENLIGM